MRQTPMRKNSWITASMIISALAILFSGPASSAPKTILFDFTKIADTDTQIPDGTTTFVDFGIPQISKDAVSFSGASAIGIHFQGVYTTIGGELRVVADTNTIVPNTTRTFSDFDQTVDMSRNNIVFRDIGAAPGIYAEFDGVLRVIADTSTPVPGGTGTFAFFTNFPAISGKAVAFFGVGRNPPQQGIYLDIDGVESVIANLSTPVPGGTGHFVGFSTVAISGKNVAFQAEGSDGERGVYLSSNGSLSVIADTNTPVPGHESNFLDPIGGRLAMDGRTVAFLGAFEGGRGLFVSRNGALSVVADTDTPVPGGTGNFIDIGDPSINDRWIAFLGSDEPDKFGLFIGVEGGAGQGRQSSLMKVIGPGDPLDGGTVEVLQLIPEVDRKDVVFDAILQDGRNGIFVGSPRKGGQ